MKIKEYKSWYNAIMPWGFVAFYAGVYHYFGFEAMASMGIFMITMRVYQINS